MNILIIGSGGREHAIAWRCKKDETVEKIFIAPGNAGTSEVGENVSLNPKDFNEILTFCKNEKIDLVIVGPEEYLALGIVDFLSAAGIICFGPKKLAAKIESDKSFAKEFMFLNNIPTAKFKTFSREEIESALSYLEIITYPAVVKVSGLAAGKGVIICNSIEETRNVINDIFVNEKFGDAGEKIVLEEFLDGDEASILVITDGHKYKILPSAQDHKRVFDNDEGPNTGGMGAYAPTPLITENLLKVIEQKIIIPTINGLLEQNIEFRGCLYFGLMIKNNNPFVIEYNCRFGDPETQVVLPLIQGNFSEFLLSSALGNLQSDLVKFSNMCAVCVVCASAGYPGEYQKLKKISGLEKLSGLNDILVFHSGTLKKDNFIFTNGGRVLSVVSLQDGNDIKACKYKNYNYLTKITFEGIHYRKDIADKAEKYN